MLCLFDLDGTLIDSEHGILACMRHAFACMGVEAPPARTLRGWIGPPLRQTFPDVVGDDPARVEQAVRYYRERFDAIGWAEHEVYPGIPDLVATLAARGHHLAIVTTKMRTQAEQIVAHLPFGGAFTRVYGPDAEGRHCTKTTMIAAALADFGVVPRDATMIGDRRFDIEGARANGVTGIGVLWGFGSRAELEAAGADRLTATPDALGDALRAG